MHTRLLRDGFLSTMPSLAGIVPMPSVEMGKGLNKYSPVEWSRKRGPPHGIHCCTRCAAVTTSSLDAPRHLTYMPDIWAGASWLRTSHIASVVGILARFGGIDRSVGRSPCALRWDRPKRRTVALRASVSSDRSAHHAAR